MDAAPEVLTDAEMQAATTPGGTQPQPSQAPPAVLTDDQMQAATAPQPEPSTDLGEQLKTAAEQFYSGQTAGLSKVIEANPSILQHIPGGLGKTVGLLEAAGEAAGLIHPVPPEEIAAREAANPITATAANIAGSVASFGAIPKWSPFAAATSWGKAGSAALKMAIEGGGYTGINKISDALLNKDDGDHEGAVSSALVDVGASALLSGFLGGAAEKGLQGLQNLKTVTNAEQFMADAGRKWSWLQKAGDIGEAVHNELSEFYESTKDALNNIWGGSNLKKQAIDKLVPAMHDGITAQNQGILDMVSNKLSEMTSDPDSFPRHLVKQAQRSADDWMGVVANPQSTPSQIFEATQTMKQQFQGWAKYEKSFNMTDLDPAVQFVRSSRDIAANLKSALEDQNTWGDAAKLQQNINKAYSDFAGKKGPWTDFEKKFTTEVNGIRSVNEAKTATYANQYNKPAAADKRQVLNNAIKAASSLRDEIANIHNVADVENSIEPISMPVVSETLNKPTPGGQFATYMHQKGVPLLAQQGAQVGGAAIGSTIGGPVGGYIGYHVAEPITKILEKMMGRPITSMAMKYDVPATYGVFKSGEDLNNLPQVQEYARSVGRGQKAINAAIDGIFKTGSVKAASAISNELSDKDRENIKKYIENGTFNEGLYHEAQKNGLIRPQGFAHGGEVLPTPLAPEANPLSKYLPTQNTMLAAAKNRVVNHLNTIRPKNIPSNMPFDSQLEIPEEKRAYESAIEFAGRPLKILDHVKNGSLTPEHLTHFVSMYPEIHSHLSKHIADRIMNMKINEEGKIPSYKVRQSLSLFLGRPLDSTMTPQSIQSAQAAFLPALPNQNMPTQSKKVSKQAGKGLEKAADKYQTTTQAAEAARTKD
jgi:hypothetical protein